MKNTIIIVVTAVCISSFAKAQCPSQYKSIIDFSNDTTAFVNYNFKVRANCYIGKTLGDVLVDLKIPVKSYLPIIDGLRDDIYNGVYIHLYPYNVVRKQHYEGNFINTIYIEFEKPIDENALDALEDKTDPNKWTYQIESFLKSQKINEMGIVQ